MASESRARPLERERLPRSDITGSVKLGLVAAPEIPEKIANELADELPELLHRHVDERISWEVSVVCDPLTGAEREAPEILDSCQERLEQEGWDLAVCLTDLPIYRGEHLIVADVSASRGVAGLSLPALGALRLRSRAREATLQIVNELYARIPELGKDASHAHSEGRDIEMDTDSETGDSRLPGRRPHRLVNRRLTEIVAPFRRVEPPDEDMKEMNVDARFAAPGVRGHLRLLSGMVLANRPWKILPSFKSTLAATFATGAYAMIFTTIWQMSDLFGWPRLTAFMIVAMIGMVAWIIVGHGLWERSHDREERHWRVLYNGVTVLTLGVAMLLSYAVLFVLFLVAAGFFVPASMFQSTVGHPVGLSDYLAMAWLTASLATIAGALGSSLEDEDTVREATYGYRQRRRNQTEDDSEDDQ